MQLGGIIAKTEYPVTPTVYQSKIEIPELAEGQGSLEMCTVVFKRCEETHFIVCM